MQTIFHPVRTIAFVGACLALASAGMSAQAAITSPVTVTLSAPGGVVGNSTPISLVDVAATATGVNAGDGTPVGNFMLPGEFIHFSGNSILLDIAAGDINAQGQLITGYLGSGVTHALYQLSNLAVAGNTITGVSGSFTGLNSPATFASIVSLVSPSTLTVNLDNLIFTPVTGGGQSDAFATVTINLALQPVPEPETWALLLAGGLAILAMRRTTRRD